MRSIVISLFHLRGRRVGDESNLAATVIQTGVIGRLSRHQPIPTVSVLDAGGFTSPLNLFGDQLTVLVLHGSLVSLGLRLEAADGVQLHAAPIEFQNQVFRSPFRTVEFLRSEERRVGKECTSR